MSNFPNKIDDDVTLPPVYNNLTEIGSDAINALREAAFNIEEEIGIGASGNLDSIAARINVSIDQDGYIRPASLQLSTLFPIKDDQVAAKEPGYNGIAESKLNLNYGTDILYGYYKNLASKTLTNEDWINDSGAKVFAHVFGDFNQHYSNKVLVSPTEYYLKNRFENQNPEDPSPLGSSIRNNANLYELITDINNDYVIHQKMDGYNLNEIRPIITLSGQSYPSNFAHTSSGIYVDSSNFSTISSSVDSVQKFAEFVDANSMMLIGSRVQSLFTSGISRASRSSSLTNDGHGVNVIPDTLATCYLNGALDDPSIGDDVIELKPTSDQLSDLFASKFSSIKVGDVANVTYTNFGSTSTVSVGNNPVSVATHPDGYKAYVASYASNTVSCVDLYTGSLLGPQIPLVYGTGPKHIAITSDGTKAVVVNYESSNATIINLVTNSITATISCGTKPRYVSINAAGTRAVVVNEQSNNISIVNLVENTKTDIPCGNQPVYADISEDDAIVAVINYLDNTVTFIDLNTYELIKTVPCDGSGPVAGKFYSYDSKFVVINETSGNLNFIRTNDNFPIIGSISCGSSPKDIAITPDGKVAAIINYGSASVNLIDLENEAPLSIVYCDENPNSISIVENGTKALITCGTDKLNVLDLATYKISVKIQVGTGSSAVATTIDSSKAVVVNSASNNVSIININDIGVIETKFTVKERKTVWDDSDVKYSIRIDGKNLFNSTTASVRVDRALFNVNKGGALSISAAKSNDSSNASLIISHPRGAVAIGNGFNASEVTSESYNLYLILYPNGNAKEYIELKPVDITGGEKGSKAGSYTLESIIASTNKEFRRLNYRFNAFSYNGQFGIMLADSYRNASFSIIAGAVDTINQQYINNDSKYPKNIIKYESGYVARDPLGLSLSGSNAASIHPGDLANPSATLAYQFPTKIFYPLKRNNFYVDGAGIELDKFSKEKEQYVDSNGDGYWIAKLTDVNLSNFDFTYTINNDLKSSALAVGKTAIVQPISGEGVSENFGRFVIKNLSFTENTTSITFQKTIVFPATSATLPSGSANENDGYDYAIYFNADSATFNLTNSFENQLEDSGKIFKKNFDVFINKDGKSFTSERARALASDGSYATVDGVVLKSSSYLSGVDIVKISPKLRGYLHGTTSKISLMVERYDSTTGDIRGYLYDSGPSSNDFLSLGTMSYAKNGDIARFYDDTGVDYIDFKFNIDKDAGSFSNKKLSLQLFPSLSLDDELLLIACCQLNTSTKDVTNIIDLRQFGNVSEKDISTSLINYISTPERLIHSNGIINGFNASYSNGVVSVSSGGTALVNGKFIQLGPESLKVPQLNEVYENTTYPMLWAICANESSQYEFVALCDSFDTGPSVGQRNVIVNNVNSSNNEDNYFIVNSFVFKNLVNDAKHLIPLYILQVNVSKENDVISYLDTSFNDVRRIISNEPLNNSFTWASPSSEITSYFKSFDAVKNWVNYYGDTSNTIKIRGAVTLDSSSNDFSKFNRPLNFEGDGSVARFDITTQTFDIGQNISYKNIKFKFAVNPSLDGYYCTISQSGTSGYCSFENVEFFSSSNDEYLNIDTLNTYNKFENCLFSSTVKRLYITSNCIFRNVRFDRLYSSSTDESFNLITLKSYNSFIDCKFVELVIAGDEGEGNLISYDSESSSNGNNNLFENCIFETVSSQRGGINLKDNNKIVNCAIYDDVYVKRNLLTFEDGNLIDGLLFGRSIGGGDLSWAVQQSESDGYHTIQINSKNTIKNVYGAGIICNSQDGYAIKINSSGNVIDNINFEEIKADAASINISNQIDNFIINSNFKCLSKSGIYLSSSSTSNSSRVVIENNKITYLYTGTEVENDNVKSSYGGLISITNSCKNITIKNCVFSKKSKDISDDKCLVDGNGVKISLSNLVQSDTSQFPPIISVHATSAMTIESLRVDRCKFIGDLQESNKYYASIAIASATSSDNNRLSLSNVHITNNSSTTNSGFIVAGQSGYTNITAENVIISQNNFSYISAYSSPYRVNGNILIDGNSCYGIISLTYEGITQVNNLDTTGDMTISNNSCQFINVYVAGNK